MNNDLISRSALLEHFQGRGFVFESIVRMLIEEAHAVDAEPVRHGRWNARPHHKFNSEGRVIKYCDFYYCSECETGRPIVPPYNFCPNCGAKMDGDKDA